MHGRLWLVLAIGVAGFATLSLTLGQEQPTAPEFPTDRPRLQPQPREEVQPAAASPAPRVIDPGKLAPLQRQALQSAQRGADWLFRMNGVKGRFVHGHIPAIKA